MQWQPRRTAQSGPSPPPIASHSSFLCRHPWPLARTRATNYGLSAARPSTLRVCARSASVTHSSAHVRSIGQRGRQSTRRSTHPACHRTLSGSATRPLHQRLAPGRAHQRPPQSRNRPARNPTSLALSASVNGLQAASPETRHQPRPPTHRRARHQCRNRLRRSRSRPLPV